MTVETHGTCTYIQETNIALCFMKVFHMTETNFNDFLLDYSGRVLTHLKQFLCRQYRL